MPLRRSYSTSQPRRYSPARSTDIPDVCFATAKPEQARPLRWPARNLIINTEASSRGLSHRSTKRLTPDMSIRSRCQSHISNSTTRHWWTCSRTADNLSSTSRKMRRVMSLSRAWLEEERITKNKRSRCFSKERTIKLWLSIDSIKTAQGHTLSSLSTSKSGARWRAVRRSWWARLTSSTWLAHSAPKRQARKAGLLWRRSSSTNHCPSSNRL